MGSIDKLVLASVICGIVALGFILAGAGYYWLYDWLYEGPYPIWAEQLVLALSVLLAPVLGLVGVAWGVAALKRPGVRQGERSGRTLARVGIALGVCPLLLVCLPLSIGLYTEGLEVFGH